MSEGDGHDGHDGSNGTARASAVIARGCSHCEIPGEVARLSLKTLAIERDMGNAEASLSATAERISELVGIFGSEIGHLTRCVHELDQAVRCLARERSERDAVLGYVSSS